MMNKPICMPQLIPNSDSHDPVTPEFTSNLISNLPPYLNITLNPLYNYTNYISFISCRPRNRTPNCSVYMHADSIRPQWRTGWWGWHQCRGVLSSLHTRSTSAVNTRLPVSTHAIYNIHMFYKQHLKYMVIQSGIKSIILWYRFDARIH